MTDTGVGFYIAMGIGAFVGVILAYNVLKFIVFAIQFILTKNIK
jgi:hypothetical protein